VKVGNGGDNYSVFKMMQEGMLDIEKERAEQERLFGNGRTKTYLPFCMTKLLENFSYQGRRDVLEDEKSPNP
jgi:acid phosphatase class B